MLLLSWTATAFIKGVAAVTRGDYMVFSSNMPLAGGNIASVGLREWHANSVMWGASTAGTASVSPLQAAGCRECRSTISIRWRSAAIWAVA